ncbi:MAG: 7,8-didemethyl-8-hydroxy-5-deazariboflavin synthase subunit CofG [Candidatus Methanospirareceae archaeon]
MVAKYVTFSKNIFIPVTNVCRNACDYCGFRARGVEDAYLMRKEDLIEVVRDKGDAIEALFTLGEKPELSKNHPFFKKWLHDLGYSSIVSYTKDLCKLAIEHGLLPHCNLGILSEEELRVLREVCASMGLMLETIEEVEAHRKSPGKDPKKRLKTIEYAGKLKIPFTTGILVGIGESREGRIRSLKAIREIHEKYGHIQEVIIQPFSPKPFTPMANVKPPSLEEIKETVRIARSILPKEVAIQVPPNLIAPKELIEAGASDLGGISEKTIDYINPEAPWPSEEELRREIAPFELRERLPIYPRFIKKKWWHSEEIGDMIERYADEEGLRKKN